MDHTEILAPAGSFETMRAAYKAGADAVYIGGMLFGARAYADNADTKEMLQAIDYAHLHRRRLYLTVNTLLKNTEIEQKLMDYLRPFYEQGLDAVIVQDMGVLQWLRANFPDLPVHASTQMTVCGASYGRWLATQGVTRIVTPRELNIEEIAAMKQETGLEIETFVHGALCYCYSGQCLLSSMIGGRSGNRGRCAQPCRLAYSFEGEKGKVFGHLLSPKDLCGLDMLPSLLDIGVDSLKIEGRMKKPEYAALTTAIYRKYVDLYMEKGPEGYGIDSTDREQLMDLYNRGGFTDGYFKRHNGREMMSVKRPNHSGLCVGTARTRGKRELLMHVQKDLHAGDVIEMPDGTSVKLEKSAAAGSEFLQKYSGKPLSKPCHIMRTRNEALIEKVTENFVKDYELKEKIYGSVKILKDFPAKIKVYDNSRSFVFDGEIVQAAKNQPLRAEDVRKRLLKTGGTPFVFEKLEIEMDEDCYMSVQGLNELRRQALNAMAAGILKPYRRPPADIQSVKQSFVAKTQTANHRSGAGNASEKKTPKLHVLVSDLEQLETALQFSEVKRIYMNDEGDDTLLIQAAAKVHQAGKDFYLAMPYILRMETEAAYQKRRWDTSVIDGFLIRNMETFYMLRSMDMTKPCVGDYNVYCMNDLAQRTYGSMLDGITLPLELNRRELTGFKHTADTEMIIYGYLPVMVSAQCLVKNTGKCTAKPGIYDLEDRMHKHFPVKNVCHFCYNLIYNSVPLHLAEVIGRDLSAIGAETVRLQFLNETSAQTAAVISDYIRAVRGETVTTKTVREYTKGHYQRGIE